MRSSALWLLPNGHLHWPVLVSFIPKDNYLILPWGWDTWLSGITTTTVCLPVRLGS